MSETDKRFFRAAAVLRSAEREALRARIVQHVRRHAAGLTSHEVALGVRSRRNLVRAHLLALVAAGLVHSDKRAGVLIFTTAESAPATHLPAHGTASGNAEYAGVAP